MSAASNEVFEVNDRVEANYLGAGVFYDGRIVERLNGSNVYNILFDDGDRESNVPASRIRRVNPVADTAASVSNQSFQTNDRIEGNWQNRGRWYPGRVTAVTAPNNYSVHYDDGSDEHGVPSHRLRLSTPPDVSTPGMVF